MMLLSMMMMALKRIMTKMTTLCSLPASQCSTPTSLASIQSQRLRSHRRRAWAISLWSLRLLIRSSSADNLVWRKQVLLILWITIMEWGELPQTTCDGRNPHLRRTLTTASLPETAAHQRGVTLWLTPSSNTLITKGILFFFATDRWRSSCSS